ncbi:hypothetical protein EV361DRAFT_870938 [Lentinula raphanica]|nr:hypothetical protein EV361DRAFT_870938 [Lentinula raphanica]
MLTSRILTDIMSGIHFCAERSASANILPHCLLKWPLEVPRRLINFVHVTVYSSRKDLDLVTLYAVNTRRSNVFLKLDSSYSPPTDFSAIDEALSSFSPPSLPSVRSEVGNSGDFEELVYKLFPTPALHLASPVFFPVPLYLTEQRRPPLPELGLFSVSRLGKTFRLSRGKILSQSIVKHLRRSRRRELEQTAKDIAHRLEGNAVSQSHRAQASQTEHISLTIYRPLYITTLISKDVSQEISTLVRNCQAYLPFLTFNRLATVATSTHYQKALDALFPASVFLNLSARAYSCHITQISQLQELSRQLSSVAIMRSTFIDAITQHNILPSDNLALIILGNLDLLLEVIQSKKTSLETLWWTFLDNSPSKASVRQICLSPNSAEFWKTLPHISYHDFSTLGAGRWLNDEIINYFVHKHQQNYSVSGVSRDTPQILERFYHFQSDQRKFSTLRDLQRCSNTFFAGTCLFEDKASCTVAKGTLTEEDELRVRRAVKRRMQNLQIDSWDSVFIPIHEGLSHWYSARIDFKLKRIDIFDSLRETCIANRRKPVPLRKNTNLMLVLMWLAEILGEIRGETVSLIRNPNRSWICDPHSRVPFQPDDYDCGVHTLWHLKHILAYREITLGGQSKEDCLSFTQDMTGKRLRLAQELLQDRKKLGTL